MPSRSVVRYEDDFYSWTRDQAAALRRLASSRVNLAEPVDLLNVAEEIESLGQSQFRELYSRYRVLLLQLLKWQYQPDRRSPSWRITIRNQRDELAELLAASPGLKSRRQGQLAKAYAGARQDAADETGLSLERFPETCPYALAKTEDPSFWPDAA